jgi:DNA processing protein
VSEAALRLAYGGLHPDRLRGLTESWGSPEAVVRAVDKAQIDVSDRARAAIAVPAQRRRQELARTGLGFVAAGEPGFPPHLAGLPDHPPALFVRGEVPRGPAVAVVGSRRCTSYGKRHAELYGRAVAEAGWVTVSGLARGVDGAAHRGTVAAGGRGIAVLGCGLDVDYPRQHRGLAAELVAHGGAVVSEYPPGTPPDGWRFPPRNRIISGLSQAVVVVEATVKGGALITAARALDHGIPVFATPGDVDRESSRGANLLIRDGAIPVLDADDLVVALSLVLGPPSAGAGKDAVEVSTGC